MGKVCFLTPNFIGKVYLCGIEKCKKQKGRFQIVLESASIIYGR